jgi:phosphoribosylaminoimidazole carboxylase (NCAIR synthetase)
MIKILVLGGSYLQSDFVEVAFNLGYSVHVLDRNPSCFLSNSLKVVFTTIDIADVDAVDQYFSQNEMDLIVSPITEIGNKIASIVSFRHNLNYNSIDTVVATTDKKKMRELLQDSELVEPKVISLCNDLALDSYNFTYPSIVKPSVSSASRGVTLVNNLEELNKAVERAMPFCNELKDIIVEEFLVGDQYSIETISSNGDHSVVAIVREHLSGSPYFMERMDVIDHEENLRLNDKVKSFVQILLSQLKVRFGPCHIEVKIDEELNIKLIEIASRSGLVRDRLIRTANGVDYNELIINSYIGKPLENIELPKKSAMLGIIAYKEDIKQYEAAANADLVFDSFLNGQKFSSNPTMLTDAVGYYFIQSDDVKIFEKYKVKL